MATISASGAWTAFDFDAADAAPTRPNVRIIDDIDAMRVRDADYPELIQFITLFATGHNIGWQRAVVVLHTLMTALLNRSAELNASAYAP